MLSYRRLLSPEGGYLLAQPQRVVSLKDTVTYII